MDVDTLDDRCLWSVRLKIELRQRLDLAIGAAGLNQIVHLALGDAYRQLLARQPAYAEENENES